VITLYDGPRSGHSYRVRLFLAFLGLPYTSVVVQGPAMKEPAFLAKNALGQIPVLDDDGIVLPDSNAILVYLAERYDETGRWCPRDPVGRARVQRWLSIAAGELVQGVVRPRAAARHGRVIDRAQAEIAGQRLFDLLQGHLAVHDFLAADHATIADVSLFAYMTVADEGGIDLAPYPAIQAWLARIEALDHFVPIPRS